MSDNPYDPPKADLRDRGPARVLAERPRSVVQAAVMLWVSLALGLTRTFLEYRRESEGWEGVVAIWGVILLIAIPVNVAIWRGRNWGRIVYAVLTGLSVLTFPLAVTTDTGMAPSALEHAVQAVEFALDLGIVYLLLTRPGSLWFQYAEDRSGL